MAWGVYLAEVGPPFAAALDIRKDSKIPDTQREDISPAADRPSFLRMGIKPEAKGNVGV